MAFQPEADYLTKLFFSEMGKIPLLNPEEEINQLNKIQEAKIDTIKLLIQNEIFVNWLKVRSKKNIMLKKVYVLVNKPDKTVSENSDKIAQQFLKEKINLFYFFSSHDWKKIKRLSTIHNLSTGEKILQGFEASNETTKHYNDLIFAVNKLQELIKIFEAHNIRLVISISKSLHQYLPILDRIQFGIIGLRKACYMYNSDSGLKFSTYATWWVRQSINRYCANTQGHIRLPIHVLADIKKLLAVQAIMPKAFTELDLITRLEWDMEKLSFIRATMLTMNVGSLDEEFENNDQEDAYSTEQVDESALPPDDYASEIELRENIKELIKIHLTTREADVIMLRFGLNGKTESTLEEIGKKYKLSRERIRQIENEAMTKLKSKMRPEKFKT